MGDAGPAEVSPARSGLVRAISLANSSVVSELRPSPAASVQIARTTSSLALKRPVEPLRCAQGTADQALDVLIGQVLELHDAAARQQR